MHQLTKMMREYCLYGTSPLAPYRHVERMLSCIIVRCSEESVAGEEELLPATITSYVRMTKGLSCLCRWPLKYSKATWDALMLAARDVCHHWVAHVLPLYALLFPEDCGEVTSQSLCSLSHFNKVTYDDMGRRGHQLHPEAQVAAHGGGI